MTTTALDALTVAKIDELLLDAQQTVYKELPSCGTLRRIDCWSTRDMVATDFHVDVARCTTHYCVCKRGIRVKHLSVQFVVRLHVETSELTSFWIVKRHRRGGHQIAIVNDQRDKLTLQATVDAGRNMTVVDARMTSLKQRVVLECYSAVSDSDEDCPFNRASDEA